VADRPGSSDSWTGGCSIIVRIFAENRTQLHISVNRQKWFAIGLEKRLFRRFPRKYGHLSAQIEWSEIVLLDKKYSIVAGLFDRPRRRLDTTPKKNRLGPILAGQRPCRLVGGLP
jgi:hypothetical protein